MGASLVAAILAVSALQGLPPVQPGASAAGGYGPDNPRPGSARAGLRQLMQEHPGEPMPADRAALDAALAKGDGSILPLLRSQADPQQHYLDLNWERARLYDGAGLAVSLAYMEDLWRLAPNLPADGKGANGDTPDQLRQTAVAFALYNAELIALDGLRCSDDSAPSHRLDQLAQLAAPILRYGQGLSAAEKARAETVAINVERATAPARKDDALLCSGGLSEIQQGLAAAGDKPLPKTREPGYVGSVVRVPDAPGYRPTFVAPQVWRPKVQALRPGLRVQLDALLNPAPPRPQPPQPPN